MTSQAQTNQDLKQFYDDVYIKGEKSHYTPLLFSDGKLLEERATILAEIDWKGKNVLDVGCGTGEVPYLLSEEGATVLGIDYSKEAIKAAQKEHQRENLRYEVQDIMNFDGSFDVIVCVGMLEHVDHPYDMLEKMSKMASELIITCPHWINPRGYMLQTLWHLFEARITLADFHYLTPVHFEEWSEKLNMNLTWKTMDQSWGHGERLVKDFARRLPNVARDSNLPTTQERIDGFVEWIEKHVVPLEKDTESGGAIALYHLTKK